MIYTSSSESDSEDEVSEEEVSDEITSRGASSTWIEGSMWSLPRSGRGDSARGRVADWSAMVESTTSKPSTTATSFSLNCMFVK